MSANGTVLLVDDEPKFTGLVTEMLEGEGYTLATAHSGEEALQVYEQVQPDLVLLDVVMGGIDGFETCRRLRRQHEARCAPIVFFTSRSHPNDIARGFAAGGTDYLAKPCRTNEVRARLRLHLQSHIMLQQQKQLVEQLRSANAAKNRFIGMAAHDMRNPLVSIRGFSEFLIDGTVGPLDTKQIAVASIIKATSQQMINTLNELLDVATIEAGELKLQLGVNNLAEVVGRSLTVNRIEAAKKRTKIALEADPELPPFYFDADKIRQVVDNLISNAVKFSPAGSSVTVATFRDSSTQTCGVAVRDQGPGIPDAERDKLFKPFGRLSNAPTLNEKSTGLGLVICRNIVQAHGGTITLQNLPERGCEFRIMLPFRN